MSVAFRIKASEAQGRRLYPEYHHALRRTRIRSTYPSAKLLTLPYSSLCNWSSTDLYEHEGAIRFHFVAFSVAMSSVRACLKQHSSSAVVKQKARSFGKRCKRWTELREEGETCGGR